MMEGTEADPMTATAMTIEAAMVEVGVMEMICLPETMVATTGIETATTEGVQEEWILEEVVAVTNQETWVIEWVVSVEAEDKTEMTVVDLKIEANCVATNVVNWVTMQKIALQSEVMVDHQEEAVMVVTEEVTETTHQDQEMKVEKVEETLEEIQKGMIPEVIHETVEEINKSQEAQPTDSLVEAIEVDLKVVPIPQAADQQAVDGAEVDSERKS